MHSGLKVNLVEPSSVSLMRTLVLKKQLKKNQTTAVIEANKFAGKIIIIDNDIPNFTRDFQLALPSDQAQDNFDARQARFFNEIRISLDYYGRQHSQKKIDNILYLTSDPQDKLHEGLNDFLNVSTDTLSTETLLGTGKPANTGFVNAFGICLRDTVASDIDFNLSWKEEQETEVEEEEDKPNYLTVAVVALLCGLLIFFTMNFTKKRIADYTAKIDVLKQELGPYDSSDTASIELEANELKTKLDRYKAIPLKSSVYKYLSLIPHLLPEGVWLSKLGVRYSEVYWGGKLKQSAFIDITGYAYSKNTDNEISLVNKLIDNLKTDTEFSSKFKKIDLTAIQRDEIEEHQVSYFSITCK